MTKVEKLAKLIYEKFDIKLDPKTFRRLRPGYWQRKAEAFSWFMFEEGTAYSLGSSDSVTELLKNKDKIVIQNDNIMID